MILSTQPYHLSLHDALPILPPITRLVKARQRVPYPKATRFLQVKSAFVVAHMYYRTLRYVNHRAEVIRCPSTILRFSPYPTESALHWCWARAAPEALRISA